MAHEVAGQLVADGEPVRRPKLEELVRQIGNCLGEVVGRRRSIESALVAACPSVVLNSRAFLTFFTPVRALAPQFGLGSFLRAIASVATLGGRRGKMAPTSCPSSAGTSSAPSGCAGILVQRVDV